MAIKERMGLLVAIFLASMALPLIITGILYAQIDKHEELNGHPVAMTTITKTEESLKEFKEEVNHRFDNLEAKSDQQFEAIMRELRK